MKARTRYKWTPESLAILREMYPDHTAQEIADRIGCTRSAVHGKANVLKLSKSEAFYKSKKSGRLDGTTGFHTRFGPKLPSWNKGKSYKPGGRCAETQFKPRSKPHNTLPLGSHRIDQRGLLQQKISDKPGSPSNRWRSVHELVWIEANGPVPEGYTVVFRPGMRTAVLEEITLDRIELISRADLCRRNSRHNYPPEINEVIQLRAMLVREINKRSGRHGKKQDRRPAGSPVRDYRGAAG